MYDRRAFCAGAGAATGLALTGCDWKSAEEKMQMYGLIGKMIAVKGKRDELASVLLEGLKDMPGNISYIVADDPTEPDVLWVTEVWTDREAHQASLSLPSVQAAISKGRPLIAGMERIAETVPRGGNGV